MRNLIVGIVIGLLLAATLVVCLLPRTMIHVRPSRYDFDTTCAMVYDSILAHGWTVDAIHDCGMQSDSTTAGPKVKVFAICKKELSSALLKQGKNRRMTAVMPCRIGVYERDGKTYVSSLRIGLIGKLFGKSVSPYTNQAARDERAILQEIVTE